MRFFFQKVEKNFIALAKCSYLNLSVKLFRCCCFWTCQDELRIVTIQIMLNFDHRSFEICLLKLGFFFHWQKVFLCFDSRVNIQMIKNSNYANIRIIETKSFSFYLYCKWRQWKKWLSTIYVLSSQCLSKVPNVYLKEL